MFTAVSPYFLSSASGGPDSANVSSSVTKRIGTGCCRAADSATALARPPCSRCSSATTIRPVSRAAFATTASSSGLTVCMSSTRACTSWPANCSATFSASATMRPLAMMVRSWPSRSWFALPSVNGQPFG